jgi:hypothetical protein
MLDIRSSEDHGCDPTIVEESYDTRMPLNINDDELDPNATDPPPQHIGATDMTFNLIRFEVSMVFRKLNYQPPGRKEHLSMKEKELLIEQTNHLLEEKYLKHCNMSIPLNWVSATIGRLVLAKMWLVIHHPLQRINNGAALPPETREKLWLTSIDVLDFGHKLETDPETKKYSWLFRYVPTSPFRVQRLTITEHTCNGTGWHTYSHNCVFASLVQTLTAPGMPSTM